MLKTAFLDTSVISECSQQNVTADKLRRILAKNNMMPIMGVYPIYELARTFIKNPVKGAQFFTYILYLKPDFICERNELYTMEVKKLKYEEPVDCIFPNTKKSVLQQRISDYSKGNFDKSLEVFICARQDHFKEVRANIWVPENCSKNLKKYKTFGKLISDFFSNFDSNIDKIEWVKKVIGLPTFGEIILSDVEVKKLISNLSAYPALRTLIYNHMYLQFLISKNNATSSENRFTDALIMTEASYCTTLISNDEDLVKKHAKNSNPDIEAIYLKQFFS